MTFFAEKIWWIQKNAVPLHRNSEESCTHFDLLRK